MNTFHNDYFYWSSLAMTYFFHNINGALLISKWHLPKLHQYRVRNEVDALSVAALCSRLVKVIFWITLPAPLVLISDFHVRDFWWLFRLVIWEMVLRWFSFFSSFECFINSHYRILACWVLAFFIPRSSSGSSSNHRIKNLRNI